MRKVIVSRMVKDTADGLLLREPLFCEECDIGRWVDWDIDAFQSTDTVQITVYHCDGKVDASETVKADGMYATVSQFDTEDAREIWVVRTNKDGYTEKYFYRIDNLDYEVSVGIQHFAIK